MLTLHSCTFRANLAGFARFGESHMGSCHGCVWLVGSGAALAKCGFCARSAGSYRFWLLHMGSYSESGWLAGSGAGGTKYGERGGGRAMAQAHLLLPGLAVPKRCQRGRRFCRPAGALLTCILHDVLLVVKVSVFFESQSCMPCILQEDVMEYDAQVACPKAQCC